MDKVKKVADSITEQSHIIMPMHINGTNRLFGGRLVEWIDIVAGIVGRRHSESNVVTACIDNLQFKGGAFLNDTVVLIGKITYVGKTSMEVRVDTYAENLEGIRKPINRAYLVLVAIDEKDQPVSVPRLEVETEVERAEWEGAIKRNVLRKQRRQEGY